MKLLLSFNNIKALKLSISVCFDVLSYECFDLIVIDRISTQASKIQIFDLNWPLFSYLLTVIMSFLYLITFFDITISTSNITTIFEKFLQTIQFYVNKNASYILVIIREPSRIPKCLGNVPKIDTMI